MIPGDDGFTLSTDDGQLSFEDFTGTLAINSQNPASSLRFDLSTGKSDVHVEELKESGPANSNRQLITGLGGSLVTAGIADLFFDGDGDDTLNVDWATSPGSAIRVTGVDDEIDSIGKRDIGTGARVSTVLASGLELLTVENSKGGHGEVRFDIPSLTGAVSYIANLQPTDVATFQGSNAGNDNLVIGRYGNAWHPVGAEITQGGANVRVAGAGRLNVETGGGDDTLVIDVDESRGSDVVKLPIFFDGGDGGLDTLELIGNPTTAVENMIYRPGPGTHDGRVEFEDHSQQRLMTVEFTGLEPVRNTVTGQFHTVFGTDLSEDITYDTVTRGTGLFGGAPSKRFGRVTVDDKEAYFFQVEGVTTTPGLLLYGEGGNDRFVIELPQQANRISFLMIRTNRTRSCFTHLRTRNRLNMNRKPPTGTSQICISTVSEIHSRIG